MIPFDLDALLKRLPLPERSGALSVVLCWSMAFTALFATAGGDVRTLRDLKCAVFGCPVERTVIDWPPQMVRVYFAPGPGNGKPICTCHYDEEAFGPYGFKAIFTEAEFDGYAGQQTCASSKAWGEWEARNRFDDPLPDNQWKRFQEGDYVTFLRWHCTDGSDGEDFPRDPNAVPEVK